MAPDEPLISFTPGDHKAFMEHAVEKARLSPPGPDKFCVGAVLANADSGEVLSTGYSLEIARDIEGDLGSTHAEQCCFIKVAQKHSLPLARAEEHIGKVLPKNTILYTTMEPCNERLSGKRTCCDRIVALKGHLKTVYVGIREPNTFIKDNDGKPRIEAEGIGFEMVPEAHDLCYETAMAGHDEGVKA
jgi:pyrimidine deaminase RibD-like protein